MTQYTCPDNKRHDDDIVGCGSTFETDPDDEGLINCPHCGLWFTPPCDTCENSPHPGILWPWMPNGDDSLPWVVRCDDCGLYSDDDEAALALAELINSRVMWAECRGDEMPTVAGGVSERDFLRPFVFALPWTTVEQVVHVVLGDPTSATPEPMYEKWLQQRETSLHLIKEERNPWT